MAVPGRGAALDHRLRAARPIRRYPLLRGRRSRRVRAADPDRYWRRTLAIVLIVLMLTAQLLLIGQAAPSAAWNLGNAVWAHLVQTGVEVPETGPLDAGLPQTARIYARDGSLLAEINDIHFGYREAVSLEEISENLILATLAAEDRRFISHPGVDPIGLLRALGQNTESQAVTSGASTLEMQLIRNLYLPDERDEQTLARKIKEAVAALQLDQRFTKAEILESYLNSVYYGNMAYGAEAAAKRYFGKSARELTLAEAALLAGLPQSPTAFDPFQNPDLAKRRQEHVLDLMVEAGFITADEAQAAKAQPLEFKRQQPPPARAPHFVNYVRDLVRQRFGPEALFTGGLRIQTTLDPDIQALAEKVVADAEPLRQQAHANNTAMVVLDPTTGQVLAMVGSKNFWDASIAGQVNIAVAGRQPGSSIKPLVYLTGFEKGLNPAVTVLDQPTAFSSPPGQPPYVPTNWENRYYGEVTLRDALGNSLNVPAVKVLKYVGVPAFLDLARRFGITTLDSWDPRWLSLTLGGGEVRLLEMVGAYATIARLGNRAPVETLLDVRNSRGDVLYHAPAQVAGEQVVDPRLAYQLLHIMGDVGARLVTFGPNSPVNLPRPHMMKTGTTDDYRDTWTIGCVPQVCVGVWMGNTNNDPMIKTSSSLTAGKIWADMMQALIAKYNWPPTPFPRPDGVVVKMIRNVGSTRPGSSEHEEVFLEGQERIFRLEMDWRRPD